MTIETLKASYADERASLAIRETKSKMLLLVEQLRIASTAGLMDDPAVAVNLHGASHEAWVAVSALADSSRRARHDSAAEFTRIKEAIWDVHLMVDTIVRDSEQDRKANWLTDPPDHTRHLAPLAQEVQRLVDRLDPIERQPAVVEAKNVDAELPVALFVICMLILMMFALVLH